MIPPAGNENIFDLFSSLTCCAYSFFTGIATGVAGNWLSDKIKNRKKEPHLQLKSDSRGTRFSGMINSSNKDQVINTLLCSTGSTAKNENYEASRTYIVPFQGRDSSSL